MADNDFAFLFTVTSRKWNYDQKILDNQKVVELFCCLGLWKMRNFIFHRPRQQKALALFGYPVFSGHDFLFSGWTFLSEARSQYPTKCNKCSFQKGLGNLWTPLYIVRNMMWRFRREIVSKNILTMQFYSALCRLDTSQARWKGLKIGWDQ